ncbi:ammonium transporter [Solimonas aquatica]
MRKLLSAAMLAAICGLAPGAWAEDEAPAPAAEAPAAEAPAAAPAPAAKKEKKEKKAEAAPAEAAAPPAAEPAPAAAEAAPAEAAAAPAAEAAPAEAAAAAEAPAAATVPHCGDKGFDCNKGDVSWMLVSTAFVLFMTVPGLALFYAGMTRGKNALSTVMQSFAIFCVIAVLWVVYGYSVAFTAGSPFYGTLDKFFMHGVDPSTVAATFSKGQYLPEMVYVMFQLTFAAITVALITGGFAERMKFSAVMIFSVLWFTFSYLPIAHMVWYWDGPDAYPKGDADAAATAASHAGFLFQKGAIDFAGGTVVHINAGIAALVAAIIVGPRKGLGKFHFAPHSLMMTAIGTGMLWMGWFGFNAGSNLEATGTAGLAFFNTLFGTAVAGVAWAGTEWLLKGKPSLLGVCSGIVAGLVAITPAAGFVGPLGAFWICAIAGVVCLLAATKLKSLLGYDDALDAFGVHCVGGIIGALGTGYFVNPALGGTGVFDYTAEAVGAYDLATQMTAQLWAVGTSLLWSASVAAVILLALKFTIGIRASDEAQEEGLDLADHGEKAYN